MPSKKKKYNARFPPARVKKIMQTDEDVGKVAAAVPIIISRALELFIESLIVKTSETTQSRNAKTLTATHIKQTIHSERKFDFLRDLVATVPDHQVEEETESTTNHKRTYTPRQRKEKVQKNVKQKKKNSSESSEAEEAEEEDDESTDTDVEHHEDGPYPDGASTSKVSPHPEFVSPSHQIPPLPENMTSHEPQNFVPPRPMAPSVPYPQVGGFNPLHQNNIAQPINLCMKEEPKDSSTSRDEGQSSSFVKGSKLPVTDLPNASSVSAKTAMAACCPVPLAPSAPQYLAVPSTSSTLSVGMMGHLSVMRAASNTQEDDDYDT